MHYVRRNRYGAELFLDAQKTTPLSDDAIGRRVHAVEHHEAVCCRVTRLLPTKLRIRAKGRGIVPGFVGNVEKVGVNAYSLGGPAMGPGEFRELDDV